MISKSLQTREKVIHATLQLLNDQVSIQDLSVRRIAKLAGVSFSTINYHFQSKDNLIRESITISVNKVISRWIELNKVLDTDPTNKLRLLLYNTGEYYAKHKNVIVLLNTFYYNQWDSNLYFYIDNALAPLLSEICPEKSRLDIEKAIDLVFRSFPNAFLHFMLHPDKSSFNFFVKEEREAYLNRFADVLLFALRS